MENTKVKMIEFAKQLQQKFNNGETLKQISQWSYKEREAGNNIPYMAIIQTNKNKITRIVASPTTKQKELRNFFFKKAPNSVLPEFILAIDIEENGVIFTQRFNKGKDSVINLLS